MQRFSSKITQRGRSYLTSTWMAAPRTPFWTAPPCTFARRPMSVGSFISEKIEGKKQEHTQHKQRESFRQLRDFLISTPKYRFKEHLSWVESLLGDIGKFDRMVGGQDVKTQEEMINRQIRVFKAMTPLEALQDATTYFNMAAKSRITVATGVDRATLQQDFRIYDNNKGMHTYLHKRLREGKSLPDTQVEYQQLVNIDPPPPGAAQAQLMRRMKAGQRQRPR